MTKNKKVYKLQLSRDELEFLATGVRAIPLSGNADQLVPLLRFIASINKKCMDILKPNET